MFLQQHQEFPAVNTKPTFHFTHPLSYFLSLQSLILSAVWISSLPKYHAFHISNPPPDEWTQVGWRGDMYFKMQHTESPPPSLSLLLSTYPTSFSKVKTQRKFFKQMIGSYWFFDNSQMFSERDYLSECVHTVNVPLKENYRIKCFLPALYVNHTYITNW